MEYGKYSSDLYELQVSDVTAEITVYLGAADTPALFPTGLCETVMGFVLDHCMPLFDSESGERQDMW